MIATGFLMACLIAACLLLGLQYWRRGAPGAPGAKQLGPQAPGPRPWPIIGSLHLMANFKRIPFEAFTKLQKEYGSVFQLHMGSMKAVVISEEKDKKEVLHVKGDHFDDRPNWQRFEIMFGGDRNNSLAFCDMSSLQRARRKLLRPHTFPSSASTAWQRLDSCCQEELAHLSHALGLAATNETAIDIKPVLSAACANIFNAYFCTIPRREYEDPVLVQYCNDFDDLFWEVNNGRAMDFLHWLAPAMRAEMNQIRRLTARLRSYVTSEIMEPKSAARPRAAGSRPDMLDTWLDRVEADSQVAASDVTIDLECALFALEDILGGHTAVANVALRALIDLGARPKAQAEVRADLAATLQGSTFTLEDKSSLPRVTAAFYETVRLTCSPIVPHVANRDTTIAGYSVEAGSLVFVNNHSGHFSPDLWQDPDSFLPDRFLQGPGGTFAKPSHFQPFSTGRRSCMGYKMVENVVVSMLATVTSQFDFSCSPAHLDHQGGMLALPNTPFMFDVRRVGKETLDVGSLETGSLEAKTLSLEMKSLEERSLEGRSLEAKSLEERSLG